MEDAFGAGFGGFELGREDVVCLCVFLEPAGGSAPGPGQRGSAGSPWESLDVPRVQAAGAEEVPLGVVAGAALHRWLPQGQGQGGMTYRDPAFGRTRSPCFISASFPCLSPSFPPRRTMSPRLHSSTTTPAKARHYTAALDAALLAGAWGEPSPLQAPNGSPLDWGEAVRKWHKHTGGRESRVLSS